MAFVVATTSGPAIAQVPTLPRDCLGISVNTDDASQLRAAINTCTRALDIGDLTQEVRSELLVHRGVGYRNLRDLDRSLSDLRAARDLTPTASVLRMLAWTYRAMGRTVEAENEYELALNLDPHPQAYLSRCFVRYDSKKYKDALEDCVKAHSADPNEDSTFMTALLYSKLGQHASAQAMLEDAVGTPSDSGRIYGLLADVYDSMGRLDDAKRVRQQGQRKFPKDKRLSSPPER